MSLDAIAEAASILARYADYVGKDGKPTYKKGTAVADIDRLGTIIGELAAENTDLKLEVSGLQLAKRRFLREVGYLDVDYGPSSGGGM